MTFHRQRSSPGRHFSDRSFSGSPRLADRCWTVALVLWVFGIWTTDRSVFALDVVDRIVAVVNDEIISLYELDRAFDPILNKIKASRYPAAQEQQVITEVRSRVLDQLIEQKLTDQELKRFNITVSDQEIDFAIERIKESRSISDEQFAQALDAEGLTLEEFRQNTKAQLLRVKLVNLEIKSKIVITRDEIEAYYNAHIREFGGQKTYHLSNIVMVLPEFATDEDLQMIKTQMMEIEKKLDQGQSFASLARLYSQAPTASDGGKLGGFELEELSRQLRAAVSELKAGEHTAVLETEFGFQIILVERIDETPGKSLEEVEEQIFEKLSPQVVNDKYKDGLRALRDRSHIKIVN